MGFILRILVPRTTITDLHMPTDAIFEVVFPKHIVKHLCYLRYSTLNNIFLRFVWCSRKNCSLFRKEQTQNTPFSIMCHSQWSREVDRLEAEDPRIFKREEWWRKLFKKEEQCFFCHPHTAFLSAALSSGVAQVWHRHFRAGVKWQSVSRIPVPHQHAFLYCGLNLHCLYWKPGIFRRHQFLCIAPSPHIYCRISWKWSGKSFPGVIPLRHV